jgi:hypothetical protein
MKPLGPPTALTEEALTALVKEAIEEKKVIVCFRGAEEVCLVFNAEGVITLVPPTAPNPCPLPVTYGRMIAELINHQAFQEVIIEEWEKLKAAQEQALKDVPPISPSLH